MAQQPQYIILMAFIFLGQLSPPPDHTARTALAAEELPGAGASFARITFTPPLVAVGAMSGAAACLAFFSRLRRRLRERKARRQRKDLVLGLSGGCSADPCWAKGLCEDECDTPSDGSASRFPSGVVTPQGPLTPPREAGKAGGGWQHGRQPPPDPAKASLVLKGYTMNSGEMVFFVHVADLSPIKTQPKFRGYSSYFFANNRPALFGY